MRRPTVSGIFLIAAGIFIVLPEWLGTNFLFAAAACLVVAGVLDKR